MMVWGAFSSKGKTELAALDGKQTAKNYPTTLKSFMLPFAYEFRVKVLTLCEMEQAFTLHKLVTNGFRLYILLLCTGQLNPLI